MEHVSHLGYIKRYKQHVEITTIPTIHTQQSDCVTSYCSTYKLNYCSTIDDYINHNHQL